VTIQPEFIRVSRPGSGPGFNVIEGQVQALEFAGEFYDADIAVNNRVIRTRASPDLQLAVGDAVEVWLDPARCRFLDA
jgi:ABC-type sugar transport system ATPase subunit